MRRMNTRKKIVWNGMAHTLYDWSKILGVPYITVCQRARNNRPLLTRIDLGLRIKKVRKDLEQIQRQHLKVA